MARRPWSISSSSSPSSGYYYGWIVVSWLCFGVAAAQECGGTDVGVVVVASVFGTLAVVGVVVVIVLFLLRRRNGGVLCPPRGRTARAGMSEEEGNANKHTGYDNAAFSVHDAAEREGRRKSSPKKNQSPGKKLQSLKTESQKTWVSLPGQEDFTGSIHRQGSCGSLGTNCTVPETVSVWLQSQDIIGLGFNISGNMRDGIFVSQVHSRGPAIESGKISVGDRILNVTIGYENIVYEDALTILSYASPYPVQVTVQKEQTVPTNTQSGTSKQLNHPLYRSQSLDALQNIGRDPLFGPSRTHGRMKSDTQIKRKEVAHKAKQISHSYSEYGAHSRGQVDFDLDILVHRAGDLSNQISVEESQDTQAIYWDMLDSQNSLGEFQHNQEMVTASHSQAAETAPTAMDKEEMELQVARKKSRLDTEAAREFASLMEQVQEAPSKKAGDDSETNSKSSPKFPPSKPERKKKPSNSSTVSSEDSAEALTNVIGVDETFQSESSLGVQALPTKALQLGSEVQEQEIQQSFVKREITISSENIEPLPVETQVSTERPPSPDGFVSVSLSDHRRSVSPKREAVEEEIQAAATSRDVYAGPPSGSSKIRDKSNDRLSAEKEKKKKKEQETKPALDNEELERLIAMNAFPPGSQGWAGIHAGGKQGGIHDDFMPRDLAQQILSSQPQAANTQRGSSSSSEASSQSYQKQRGGVAFEVREDMLTGRPMSVDISRSRNSSASPSRSGSRDRISHTSSVHDNHGQVKQQHPEDKENREDHLDWSSKRLVRAGSFSHIPQDDSLGDWTDKNKAHDDDDNSTTSGKPSTADTNPDSDSEMDPPRPLATRDVFKARENLANMSDLSNSISSSRSSSPAVTNGPADGGTSSVSSLPSVKTSTTTTVMDLPPTSDPNANSKTVSVTLHTGTEEDMDC